MRIQLSVFFAAFFSFQILFFSGCRLFQTKDKTAQIPPQTASTAISPSIFRGNEPAKNEPLDPKYSVFKPVLPPLNGSPNGYTVPTNNIVDNIFGKSTDSNTPSTVKMLPIPEISKTEIIKTEKTNSNAAGVSEDSKKQIEELNNRITLLEKSLVEKDKQLQTAQSAAKTAEKTEEKIPPEKEQPLPPKTIQNTLQDKGNEKQLPLPNSSDTSNTLNTSTEFKPIPFDKTLTDKVPADKQPKEETKKEFKAMAPLGIAGVVVSTDTAKRQTRIEFPDSVLFQANGWTIQPDAEKHLRRIAGEIRACYPDAVLDIEGHTDNIDRDPANKTQKHDIASFKSMTVMQYFINALKWDASKITSSSYGAGKPVADNGTPEGRARNNRIEIVVKP